ncbi:MAG: hypothetical protein PHG91_08025 [Syntrophales bacterium]|nr:hypothetical protein [Syntrophales bacterium]MDD5233329.1 hypothetical protein [Syntrophales bacterium]MDD5532569.1 hypothetical protein [Syntrophales bacterium]HPL63303.1 hypothetical protein [Syntrophales bacterium]
MARRYILAVILIFFAWTVFDFIIHAAALERMYASLSHLWRPVAEMNAALINVVRLVESAAFAAIFALLVAPKNLVSGLKYGLLFGIAAGVPMGLGAYAFMPVPLSLGIAWSLGVLAEAAAGGLILGALFGQEKRPAK